MPPRKSTLTELDQMVAEAQVLTAKECQCWHPERRVKCQLSAGHQGPHKWNYVSGSRSLWWNDKGRTCTDPQKRKRRVRTNDKVGN